MTQKIIALVDGSAWSASVCAHAAWIAGRTGAAVELLHVLGRPEGADRRDLSGAIGLGARTALMTELAELDAARARLATERGRAILEDAHALLTRDGVAAITSRLRHGGLVENMADMEADAAMIVIGKRGADADHAQGHLGSNLERVVRASHKPILVAARAFRPIETVLLAFDGGPSALKAVDCIAGNPLFAGLAVHVVWVGAATPEVTQRLDAATQRLTSAGIGADSAVVTGHPETALGKLVEGAGYDLLVMGAYGHSRIRGLVIGSTTTGMLMTSKVPVLLIR